jgi:hypothetical protein
MVEVSIKDKKLILNIKGVGKVLALKSEFIIPLTSVKGVTADPGVLEMPKGLRAPGTAIPGVFYAGTFFSEGDKVFWNVRHADKAIVIELEDEDFARLIIEVENPTQVVELIEKSL